MIVVANNRVITALVAKRRPATRPDYEVIPRSRTGRFRNRSASPTRIAIGSRSVRTTGSFPLIARTAMQSPSSKGSETISKRSPYIFMWTDAVKPRSLIFAQLSEQIFIVFSRSLKHCSPRHFQLAGNFGVVANLQKQIHDSPLLRPQSKRIFV
jgi:hypothetical protein